MEWQIWIASGDRPRPCRYVITSPKLAAAPQYTIDIRSWKTGSEAAADFLQPAASEGGQKAVCGGSPGV